MTAYIRTQISVLSTPCLEKNRSYSVESKSLIDIDVTWSGAFKNSRPLVSLTQNINLLMDCSSMVKNITLMYISVLSFFYLITWDFVTQVSALLLPYRIQVFMPPLIARLWSVTKKENKWSADHVRHYGVCFFHQSSSAFTKADDEPEKDFSCCAKLVISCCFHQKEQQWGCWINGWMPWSRWLLCT